MKYQQITFEHGKVAHITLNRPQYLNAQSWLLREEMDHAFALADNDDDIGAIVLSGAGGTFSAGHDVGTREDREYRIAHGHANVDPKGIYDNLKEINVSNTLRWRNLRKPTIAQVDGYCIFGGWMIAAAMDLIFADENALFLPGQTQYFSAPWDIGPKKAKEILFEHRFMTAEECHRLGYVNRVYKSDELERETMAYAERVATNYLDNPIGLETTKRSINHMMDTQGFTAEIGAAFENFCVMLGLHPRKQTPASQGGYARTDVAKQNLEASRPWI